MSNLTGHVGIKKVDGGYRMLHVELGFKAYGRTPDLAATHFSRAMSVHKREMT